MKTTIDIPDKELQDAMKYAGAKTKREAVVAALADYNRRRRMAELVKYGGAMTTLMTNEEIEAMDAEAAKPVAAPRRRGERR